jgi:hypothetical protein
MLSLCCLPGTPDFQYLKNPQAPRLIIAGVLIGLTGLAHQFGAILLGAVVVMGFFPCCRVVTRSSP